jgi:Flp pilus assembly protein CpaB
MSMPSPHANDAAQNPLAKASQVPTRRRTRIYLGVAVVAALVAAGILFMGTGEKKGIYVLRAKQDIPALGILNKKLFVAGTSLKEDVPSGAFTAKTESELWKAADVENQVAQYPLSKNSILEKRDLTTEASTLAVPLGPTERLISVPAAYSDSLAGGLRVGDRVDIYGLGDSASPVAQLLVSNVEIAGVSLGQDQINTVVSKQVSDAEEGKQTSRTEGLPSDPIPGVYTLRVGSSVVPRLAVVGQNGTLMLALRGAGAQDVPVPNTDIASALCAESVLADGAPGPVTTGSTFCTPS